MGNRWKEKNKSHGAFSGGKRKLILALCVVVVGAFTMAALSSCSGSTDEAVSVDKEKIDSLYSVVGERKVNGNEVGVKDDVDYEIVTYSKGDVTEDDVYKYTAELQKQGYLLIQDVDTTKEPMEILLAKEAEKSGDGNIIIVSIEYTSEETVITYKVGEGTLTKY